VPNQDFTFNEDYLTLDEIYFGLVGDEKLLTREPFASPPGSYLSGYLNISGTHGTVTPGSTIVTLSGENFLKHLPTGQYRLIADFTSGAQGMFVISIVNLVLDGQSQVGSESENVIGSGNSSPEPVRVVRWLEREQATMLAALARGENRSFAGTQYDYRFGVRSGAWDRLANLRFEHDTMNGNAIQVRLYIDNPALINSDMMLSAWVSGKDVDWTRNLFERFFTNSVRVVHFDHSGAWGQSVRVAARVNLADMNIQNLVFYSYDRASNSYRRIANPAYRIDANGFLHFTTSMGGDIIISDGPLTRR